MVEAVLEQFCDMLVVTAEAKPPVLTDEEDGRISSVLKARRERGSPYFYWLESLRAPGVSRSGDAGR